jgi:hypothetical protein
MNFDAIAQAAYEKWAAILQSQLLPRFPRWEQLTNIERLAWRAAVVEAIDIHTAAVMA